MQIFIQVKSKDFIQSSTLFMCNPKTKFDVSHILKTHNKKLAFVVTVLLAIVVYKTKYFENEKKQSFDSLSVDAGAAEASLREHSKIFEKRIEKVTDGVYVAIGYALSNMIFLEGKVLLPIYL